MTATVVEATLGTADLTSFADISTRQADYWTRTGAISTAVTSRGSGVPRVYTLTEARMAWLLGRIQDARGASGSCGGTYRDIASLRPVLELLRSRPWGGWLMLGQSEFRFAETATEVAATLADLGLVVQVFALDTCPAWGESDEENAA